MNALTKTEKKKSDPGRYSVLYQEYKTGGRQSCKP